MRKCVFLFLFPIFLLFSTPVFAHEIGMPEKLYIEHVGKFDQEIKVNTDGTLDIAEIIDYDFGTKFRHGIYRNIPYTKIDKNNKRVDLTFENFKVEDENGNPYKFKKSNQNRQIILKIGDPNNTITGTHTYVISYEVKGAVGYFKDHDELYWNSTGNGWNVPIAAAQTHIFLPKSIPSNQIKTRCFTGSQNSITEACTIIPLQENAFHFSANHTIPPYSGLTVLAGFPKNLVAVLLPTVYVSFWQKPQGIATLFLIFIGLVFWYLFLPIYIFIKYFLTGRDPFVGKAVTAWFDPPHTKSGRKLVPAETGALLDESVQKRDIFSSIVDLARRGYIKIEERKEKEFHLHRTHTQKAKDKLLPFETRLLDGIFDGVNTIKLKDTKIYKTIIEVETMLYKDLVEHGFFTKNPRTTRMQYYAVGFIALFTFNWVFAFMCFFFGRIMPRKTLFGAKQANVARGMKNFLSSQKRQLAFQADKQIMFEKLLPFAIAFGVEKVWAKRFEKFNLKHPDWYSGYGSSAFNSVILASSLSNSYSSFSTSSTPPSSTGSGFGGGGFSGGGGGGGGGGSW